MIKAIIVENEIDAESRLIALILQNYSDIKICAITRNIKDSLDAIHNFQPDLIFLDVELNRPESGFDILEQLAEINFKVIFTTGYDKYAIRAIEFSALDYLLKPIDEDKLKRAVGRFVSNRIITSIHQRDALLSFSKSSPDAKIPLPDAEGYTIVPVRDILFFEGMDNRSVAHLIGKGKIITSRVLKHYETVLEGYGFFRIHKSYLVNTQHIIKYSRAGGGFVRLKEVDRPLSVSKSLRDDLLEKLRNLK